MTAEELYEKEFGNADSIAKESVIRLLRIFAKALELQRKQSSCVHDAEWRRKQIITFTEWLSENHSIEIHDMILQDYLHYGII